MLEKVKEIFQSENQEMPNHVAMSTSGIEEWAKKNNKSLEEANKRSLSNITMVLREQISLKVPVVTVFLLREDMDKDSVHFKALIDSIVDFFSELKNNQDVHENKVKVSIIGKWYNLPSRVVDPIKAVVAATRDYDKFFLNFCINYDGREEVTDACRLLARQIESGKLKAEAITQEQIKGNLYSSYFPPVDVLIKNGKEKATRGLLLWDSVEARIHFSDKLWPDFSRSDFVKALQ